MTQDARTLAEGDPFVLLITDRPADRRGLTRGIETAMACRTLGPRQSRPPERPQLVVIDLEMPSITAAMAGNVDVLGRPIPSLILLRDASSALPRVDWARSLPAGTPHEVILAGIFGLIEDTAAGARRLRARGEAATEITAELFDSAALGAGLQQADADRGTDIVLEAVSEAGIGDWLATIWRHDVGVYQHTLSVAGYAAAFGTRIGLGVADHRRLTKAALLHDIGKSRIPAAILNKPARLSPEELRLIRRHADIGADLLAAQGGFEPAILDVVRHHHEKLDGTGYPAGLRGDAIVDLVRIVAICDVFSALTERRFYRAPVGATEALSTMAEMQGHLDPALLRIFEPVARAAVVEGSASHAGLLDTAAPSTVG